MAPPPPDPAEAMVEAVDWRRHRRYCILAPWMAMSAPPPPAPCMICAAAAACRPGEVVPEGGERDELRQHGEEVGAWPVRHGVESHLYETLLEVLEEMHPYLLDPGLQTIRLEQHNPTIQKKIGNRIFLKSWKTLNTNVALPTVVRSKELIRPYKNYKIVGYVIGLELRGLQLCLIDKWGKMMTSR
uniref:Uncharacterized protein n=1 Tax=Oryza barthii TaxID=65489 RepID=A0A0D3FTK0_9ORYZ